MKQLAWAGLARRSVLFTSLWRRPTVLICGVPCFASVGGSHALLPPLGMFNCCASRSNDSRKGNTPRDSKRSKTALKDEEAALLKQLAELDAAEGTRDASKEAGQKAEETASVQSQPQLSGKRLRKPSGSGSLLRSAFSMRRMSPTSVTRKSSTSTYILSRLEATDGY